MLVSKIEPYKSKYELKYSKWLFKSVIVYLIVTIVMIDVVLTAYGFVENR